MNSWTHQNPRWSEVPVEAQGSPQLQRGCTRPRVPLAVKNTGVLFRRCASREEVPELFQNQEAQSLPCMFSSECQVQKEDAMLWRNESKLRKKSEHGSAAQVTGSKSPLSRAPPSGCSSFQ